MSDQPPSGQPPPTYQPPPPSPNPLIPRGNQRLNTILAGINPRIWVGAVISIVVIVVVLLLASQPRATDGVNPTQIALEQTSTQNAVIFITQTFSAITPTIDAQVAALQTQNALQAQALTAQAATNQAIALLPTQTAVVITSPPVVIIQPTEPPIIIIEPTKPPQVITATSLPPTAQPTKIITATPLPPTAQPTPTLHAQNTIYNCPVYHDTGIGKSLTLDIDVPAGQIAFIDAYSFDDKVNGVFVTITGAYKGKHTFRDGAYCGGINVTDDYQPVLAQRLEAVRKGGNYVEIHLGVG